MSRVVVRLFGPPSVQCQHPKGMRELTSSKCVALLTYLLLEPGPHDRQSLATLLWGDSLESAARASLRQALKRLRDGLGEAVRVDRHEVELTGPVECDVVAFLDAADRNPSEAAGYDVPRFLCGFAVRHAAGFEDWATTARRNLLSRFEGVLRKLSRDAMARSRWRESFDWAERWVACNPLSEEATRLAMEASYLDGNRGAALRRFEEYRERLARELQAEPGSGLVDLARRIAGSQEVRPEEPAAEAPSQEQPDFDAPMVGRDSQWSKLMEVWEDIAAGSTRLVLIEGEQGLGKTRLAEEFLRWASIEGALVLRGQGYDPHAGIPYATMAEALRALIDAPGIGGTAPEFLTELTRLLPEVRRRFPSLPSPTTPEDATGRLRLFEGVAQVILSVADEQAVVLFVDDLQWCDRESCALLHFLAHRLEGSPLALIVGLTQGDAEGDAPPLRLCRALRAHRSARILTLSPLSETDVWELIRELGHISAPAGGRRFAARIHAVTDGHPFHVMELIKTLFAQGLLSVDPETGEWLASWQMNAPEVDTIQMPQTVRDAIGERLARLPYELKDILATIAAAGTGVRTNLLSHVHGISRLRASALADALVERRLLVEERGFYRCAHPVISDVVREELTDARRRELHRAIALSLEASAPAEDRPAVAGPIAWHASRGGERGLAYRFARLASDQARDRYAFEEALSWLDLASTVADTPEDTAVVNLCTEQVLQLAGWARPPAAARRPGTPARGIDQKDLDFRVSEKPDSH